MEQDDARKPSRVKFHWTQTGLQEERAQRLGPGTYFHWIYICWMNKLSAMAPNLTSSLMTWFQQSHLTSRGHSFITCQLQPQLLPIHRTPSGSQKKRKPVTGQTAVQPSRRGLGLSSRALAGWRPQVRSSLLSSKKHLPPYHTPAAPPHVSNEASTQHVFTKFDQNKQKICKTSHSLTYL